MSLTESKFVAMDGVNIAITFESFIRPSPKFVMDDPSA